MGVLFHEYPTAAGPWGDGEALELKRAIRESSRPVALVVALHLVWDGRKHLVA